ncbi:MAG TPA: response regulator transcription factor [Pyrinomonadaceae bacterium]|nr:response regulator transcription factor [Pyrinomonadaceae bacterium]
MRVLIADDHAIVRRGLIQILTDAWKTVTVGEARDVPEVLRLASEQDWDIVVLDISMPGRNGLEALKELRQVRPRTPVLILTTHPAEQYAIRVLRAGAAGYMTKESAPEHLVEAVRRVTAGGKYISPALAELLAASVADDSEKPPHESLSDREYQVLCMIASGKTVGQIALELSLSDKTISTYRARILEKMGMKTNADLTHYAISNRLTQ